MIKGDDSFELLLSVYDCSHIGMETLKTLIENSEDFSMIEIMAKQFAEYHNINEDAKSIFENSFGNRVNIHSGINVFAIKMAMKINLLTDRTSSHMAEMLMQGSIMGIIDVLKSIREFKKAHENIVELAQKLVATEENNISELKNII